MDHGRLADFVFLYLLADLCVGNFVDCVSGGSMAKKKNASSVKGI